MAANPLEAYLPAALLQSLLSTTLVYTQMAENCIDGSFSTLCATRVSAVGANWLAVRVPTGTRVGPVAVYNRRSYSTLRYRLGTFTVSVGSSAGDTGGVTCGSANYNASSESRPYIIPCAGAANGEWVTIRQVACPGDCMLALAEVAVYIEAGPPPPACPYFLL